MSSSAGYRWIHRVWYEGDASYVALLPLTALFFLIVAIRRWLYSTGILKTTKINVPVIVVGNITAGGTGKTPTTIWLASELQQRGFTPGIVSRGYGGSKSKSPMLVDADSDPAVVGDEPVMLARRSSCAVAVDADRVRAAEMLVGNGVDVIIADDGLQHYRLGRDYEICVIDGKRGLGNRFMLPAGPLREPLSRIPTVDQVFVNGDYPGNHETISSVEQNALKFDLIAGEAVRLNGSQSFPLERFANSTVHGVAGIGNPKRFFDLLRDAGMQVIEHAWPDHATIGRKDVRFKDDFDVLMTEKDAVKFGTHAPDKVWYVPVDLEIDPLVSGPWLEQIESRLRGGSSD